LLAGLGPSLPARGGRRQTFAGTGGAFGVSAPAGSPAPETGLAARYPGDAGLARDPAVADGVEALWIDGAATIRKTDVRFRRTKDLRITFFSLETYYHGLPEQYTRASPIKVQVDHVVIAREYIGPLVRV